MLFSAEPIHIDASCSLQIILIFHSGFFLSLIHISNANSRDALIGNYYGTSSRYITPLEGLQQYLGEDTRVLYAEGCHLYKDKVQGLAEEKDRFKEALIMAEQSDAVSYTHLDVYKRQGFNYVTFMVNGTAVVNPAAPVGFGYNRAVNFAEVPERNFSWHELKKTDHGQIHIHYSCDGDGQVRMNYVYTPAGYGEDSCDTGRVGVLECASDERDFCWIHQGKIANIMDNLSGEGRIKGIMIIMADSMISVSYTHLDVYKRQTLYCKEWVNDSDIHKRISGFTRYRKTRCV